jgi:hypothetical protein
MRLDVLTPEGQALLPTLKAFSGFYLAGGTALALQLGHRQSVDFDLFTQAPIPSTLLETVERTYGAQDVVPLVNHADELTVRVKDTKLTFLTYPFPLLDPLVNLDGLPALGVAELAVTKAYTIGRRGALKDYVDLYTVVAAGQATLPELSQRAARKYGDRFNARLFLEQLIWLDDVEDEPIVFVGSPVTKAAIVQFFEAQVKAFPLTGTDHA